MSDIFDSWVLHTRKHNLTLSCLNNFPAFTITLFLLLLSDVVIIKHGRVEGRGGSLLFEESKKTTNGWSRFSQPYLSDAISQAVRRSIFARPGSFANVFSDVDFTSEEGFGHLFDLETSYTPETLLSIFDNSKDTTPLFPFSGSASSMFLYFRAAIASRRHAEVKSGYSVTSVSSASPSVAPTTTTKAGSKRGRTPG